jgi:hypothetical protein
VAILSRDWESPGELVLVLEPGPTEEWKQCFYHLTGISYVGHGPETVRFLGRTARITGSAAIAAQMLDQFKQWIAKANSDYKAKKEKELADRRRKERSDLAVRRKAEEQRLQVLKTLPPV